jgi:antitoxin (DNA-binding transcriptional repressor) of toxin-antitoxin stability system
MAAFQAINKKVTLAEAEAGTAITITCDGRPVARIVGAPAKAKRVAGDWGWTGT